MRHLPSSLRVTLFLALGTTILAQSPALGDVPMCLSHQGRVLDSNSQPLDGVFSLDFTIYDAQNNGSSLWTENLNLLFSEGIYNAVLGLTSPLDILDFNQQYWLGVSVDGEPELPRTKLTSVPYALRAEIHPGSVDEDALTFDPATQTELDTATQSLQAAIQQLNQRIDALEQGVAEAGRPFILGLSAFTSNGAFIYSGHTGMRAATQMCQDTYSNVTAHMCTTKEVQTAVALELWDINQQQSMNNQTTWTVTDLAMQHGTQLIGGTSLDTSCNNFLYNSGHVSTGSTMTVRFDYTAPISGVQGAAYEVRPSISCGNEYPVLCCGTP